VQITIYIFLEKREEGTEVKYEIKHCAAYMKEQEKA
jgi:hypothetical protein